MKIRLKKTVPWLVVVLLLTSFIACNCAGSKKISIDLMEYVPLDSNLLVYWEVKTLGTDESLEDIYDKYRDSEEINQLRDVGVLRSDIEQSGRASGFGQATVTIFTGKMDIDALKGELDKREDYALGHHQEASIWTPDDTEANKSIAVTGDIVLIGEKDDIIICINAIVLDQEPSLNEDDDITNVVDRLPDGVLVYINKAGSDPEEDYTDLIAYGKSYAKHGDEELKLTAVYMFEDYPAAGNDVQDAIIDYLSDNGFREPKVERFDELYLRATALIYITDFVNALDW